MAAIFKTLMTT